MLFSSFLLLVWIVGLVVCKVIPATHASHEKRNLERTQGWVKRGRVPSQAIFPMRIGLKQRNLERGYDYVLEVYVVESEVEKDS